MSAEAQNHASHAAEEAAETAEHANEGVSPQIGKIKHETRGKLSRFFSAIGNGAKAVGNGAVSLVTLPFVLPYKAFTSEKAKHTRADLYQSAKDKAYEIWRGVTAPIRFPANFVINRIISVRNLIMSFPTTTLWKKFIKYPFTADAWKIGKGGDAHGGGH